MMRPLQVSTFLLLAVLSLDFVFGMEFITLNSGAKMPALGLGTWKSAQGDVKEAVMAAIKAGYRHIDCAAVYGNEAEIGEAFTECFEKGICTREELFVTSKLWLDSKLRDDVIPALKQSLQKLQLDYLDMYLIHWPVSLKKGASLGGLTKDSFLTEEEAPLAETWLALEEAVGAQLTKGIGVSNFSPKKIDALFETAKIPPAINQVERHPFLQRKELVDYCKAKGIHVTAYSPLGSLDRPASMKRSDEPSLLQNPSILEIAAKVSCTAAQVILKWTIQCGCSVIPKSTNPVRLKENLDSVELQLDDKDMATMASLDKEFRFVDGLFWCVEGSPYTYDTLWDGA